MRSKVTGSLPQCLEQTIWMLNGWLVPERGSPVRLFFSRRPMNGPPADLIDTLPELPESALSSEPDAPPEPARSDTE